MARLFLGGLRRAPASSSARWWVETRLDETKFSSNVTVVGELPTGLAVRRSRAREGDLIYVSGALGGAELGLQSLREQKASPQE